jgi:hypothetical protein
MSFIAVAIGGSAVMGLGGSLIGANAAENSGAMQAQAAREATALQEKMYNQNRADQEPWRKAGTVALSGMQDRDYQRDFTMADFQADPGFEFRMREGMKALDRSASARGNLNSGAAMRGIARYGQDMASQEYGNAYNRFNSDRDRRFNRLSALAGIGQTANSQVGQAGANYANNAGANMMGAANAAGAAGMSAANQWGSTLNNLGNIGMQGAWMNKWSGAQASPAAAPATYADGRTFGLLGRL